MMADFAAEYLPPNPIMPALLLLGILRFENQRWSRSIAQGRRGSSDAAVLFAQATTLAGYVVGIGAIVFLAIADGWQVALVTLTFVWIVGAIAGLLIGLISGGDSVLVQASSTILFWPVAAWVIALLLSRY